jgi:hypothetical protein
MTVIDLTEAWTAIGIKFQNGLMNRIFRQQGIDGGMFPPPKPETIWTRKFKTKRVKGLKVKSGKRLWITGNYAKSAFNYLSDQMGVTVFASNNLHPGGATYADITRYNSRNYEPNKNILNPPLVFPRTQSEVLMMDDEIQFARHTLKKAITEQLRAVVPEKVEIPIG